MNGASVYKAGTRLWPLERRAFVVPGSPLGSGNWRQFVEASASFACASGSEALEGGQPSKVSSHAGPLTKPIAEKWVCVWGPPRPMELGAGDPQR